MRESIKIAIFGILKNKEKYNQTYFHTLQSYRLRCMFRVY